MASSSDTHRARQRGGRGTSPETFFATCAPGVEPFLHQEVRSLRFSRNERQVGGVRFSGSLEDAWRANLCLRTAIRVLWRIGRFEAPDDASLYRGVGAIDWRRFLSPHGSLAVTAQTNESRLDHSLFIAQHTKDAIVDQLRTPGGSRPDVERESPDLAVHVHLYRDRCTLSIDTSGESLHKRGWRRFQGRAPLSEALAAAIVLASRWDGRSPLVDPFCGSGTILIEAALIASGTPPGLFRRQFAFERLPGHDARAWDAVRQRAEEAVSWPRRLILRGMDSDPRTVEGARENLRAAGLESRVEVEAGDGTSIEFKRGWNAWVVTNPPYGERLGDESLLRGLYRRFGRRLKEQCGGYHLALLSGNPRLARELGLRPTSTTVFHNGPLRCELLELEIPR